MDRHLYDELMAEAERCKRWYGDAGPFAALAAWAEDLERRVRQLEGVPEPMEETAPNSVTTALYRSSGRM